MPKFKKGGSRAQAKKRKLYMRSKRAAATDVTDADIGKAKPMATWRASLREKMPGTKNASSIKAPTGGRLSTPNSGMPASSDSQTGECTPQKVPWPYEDSMLSGLAGQSKLVTTKPISIICRKPGAKRYFKRTNKRAMKKLNKTEQNKSKEQNTNDNFQILEAEHDPVDEQMSSDVEPFECSRTVQGNFNQANPVFGDNAGAQCVANCLSAISYYNIKDVSLWQPTDLDSILVTGNELYSFLRRNLAATESYLLIHELPTMLECYDMDFEYKFKESVASMIEIGNRSINLADFNASPLDEALQLSLLDTHACFVCFRGNTMLIGKSNGSYFAFDSHSRSATGMFAIEGKSSCVRMMSITDVINHLTSLALSMGCRSNEICEITGVTCLCRQLAEVSLNDQIQDLRVPADHVQVESNKELAGLLKKSNDCSIESFGKMEDDVELVSSTTDNTLFMPFTNKTRVLLCRSLGMVKFTNASLTTSVSLNAGKPKYCQKIIGDGNCFFRALSFCVSESEENYQAIRQKICNHLEEHGNIFQTLLRNSYDNMNRYVRASKMCQNGTWATEVEIFAAAHMLKADIYTFSNDRWLRYSGKVIDRSMIPRQESIYLNHVNANHYEVVLQVDSIDNSPSELMKSAYQTLLENDTKSISSLKKEDEVGRINRLRKHVKNGKVKPAKGGRVSEKINQRTGSQYKDRYKKDTNFRARILEIKRQRYGQDKEYRNKLRSAALHRYKKDRNSELFRNKRQEESRSKYRDDKNYREKKRRASIRKYKDDESHKNDVMRASIKKYRDDKAHKESVRQASKEKYRQSKTHRENVKMASKQKYRDDKAHKETVQQASKEKYRQSKSHRENVQLASKQKYRDDKNHRENVQLASKKKYRDNKKHRENVQLASVQKYRENKKHRENVQQASIQKYRDNKKHRENVQLASVQKYRENKKHRENVQQASIQKYRENKKHREKVLIASKQKYAEQKSNLCKKKRNENYMIDSFKSKVRKGPSCVCCSCHRLLFENQVIQCKQEMVMKKVKGYCISEKFFHSTCSETCSQDCTQNRLWLCKTCQRKINAGEVPAESWINNMSLEDIPESLSNLNCLEQHLIARHIPFMKVMALPQGGQNCMHGPVVCVPSELRKVSTLPRSQDENMLLKVKLKRKISYKGHYEYNFVNTKRIMQALEFLKKGNKWYDDVNIDANWNNTFVAENRDESDLSEQIEINEEASTGAQDEGEHIQFDTCLEPVDIGQEVLDHYFDEIYNMAPAEGKNPVKLLQEEGNEAKTFPHLFPSGTNTWNEVRDKRITLSRYLNNRLMNADNRFARDINYIFFSQYLSELNQVIEKTQISMRKSSESVGAKSVTREMMQNPEELKKLFHEDEAFRFLQPIRGTPSYWQSAQKDLFAMLRQLGIPTWFCSFSAAEFRWTETINTILTHQGDKRKAEDLNWTEKSEILRSNPVTVARMFEHRFHIFLREVILSPSEPIGKVVDYFNRVEFQQRGSPHMHCLFWVDKAPKLDLDDKETVCRFIDRYVTCEIPSENEDSELRTIVEEVQQHSKKHSKSCKKKGTECRFNFPRPPSEKTFISVPMENDDDCEKKGGAKTDDVADLEHQNKSLTESEAKEILHKVWEKLLDVKTDFSSTSELFHSLGISQEIYEQAHNVVTSNQKIVLKRDVNELWTNQYNPQLLKCWNANMDIQYILDPFSCIVYIVSYISKAEREMGLLLKQTKIEAEEGNLNARQTLKSIGSAYLNHREVSVQEAVYRVCNLNMKECSRKVVFVPVGDNPTRLSKPLSLMQTKNKSSDEDETEDDIWMTNIIERYQARPSDKAFDKMCLATFCSEYRVLAKSQVPEKETPGVFRLQNNKGFIQKRTRTQPAVVRYPRFSIEKTPEKYFQSVLQMFLPYRSRNQLKPPGFDLYQIFYETGHVKLTEEDSLQAVKEIVDENHERYSMYGNTVDSAHEVYNQCGEPEDAWSLLCPETEASRKECLLEKEKIHGSEENIDTTIPDLDNNTGSDILYRVQENEMPKNEAFRLMRALNEKQRYVFFLVRNWVLNIKDGLNPDPFYIFVTGGAGTGKSHLIKTLKYESSRLLSHLCLHPDDITVLLTAFTGTAAFNIGGCTIHHAFSLNRYLPLPYEPLKEQTLNAVRAKLQNLRILVIDEVSMVYKRLLYYIHERLVQIKGDKRPFGGVSVIAVGDFYQLPPVKQRKDERLYRENCSYPVDYWNTLFSAIELDQIMRQQSDQPFAHMLNMLRTRTLDMTLQQELKQMLMECIRDGDDDDALHVYSTNDEVNKYNLTMLQKQCTDLIEINARDYQRDKKSGKMKLCEKPVGKSKTDGLESCLLLAVNARVMLTRNCNVADGLVNGVMGTVKNIIKDSRSEVKGVEVEFDSANVGKGCGKRTDSGKNTVTVERTEEDLSRKSVANTVRHQFPLKLAWACTAHKVQGMTVSKVVINLDRIFSPGQAYVALSRVTAQEGLCIEVEDAISFEKKIYADAEVTEALMGMKKLECTREEADSDILTIILHNVQSLRNNIENIQSETEILKADVLCFTETWLKQSSKTSDFSLDHFTLHHITRPESYNEEFASLKDSNGGGVCTYIKDGSNFRVIEYSIENLEAIVVHDHCANITIATVYRPSSYRKSSFISCLQKLVLLLKSFSGTIIIMGDFNEDLHNQPCQINNFLISNGFMQMVDFSTTEGCTLLDHVYTTNSDRISVKPVPTYYSYHEAVKISFSDLSSDF